MYPLDEISIMTCKLIVALLTSGHESSEKAHAPIEGKKYAQHHPIDTTSNVITGARTIRFENLPGEIRNLIYELVLSVPKPISIRQRRQWLNQHFAKRYDTRSIYNAGKPKFFVEGFVDRQSRRLSVDKCVNMDLLRVSKTIGAEAAGILFRRNRFLFKSRLAMTEFGKRVGGRYAASLTDLPVKEVEAGVMLGFG